MPSGASPAQRVPEQLLARRRVWERKRVLRAVYRYWAQLIRAWLPDDGPYLEVGTGSGTLADYVGSVFQSDIQVAPWLDLVTDIHHLPVQSGRLSGCLGIDVIHHLADPHAFFTELARVLRPGGRGIFIEPYVSPFSYPVYRLMHDEPICFGRYQEHSTHDDPQQGNTAMANILFERERADWPTRHTHLKLVQSRPFGLFQILAGGFRKHSLLPWPRLLTVLNRSEWVVPQPLMSLLAFRMLVVLQRSADM